jgi:uncharacterized protein
MGRNRPATEGTSDLSLDGKVDGCRCVLAETGRVVVAFSAGVDSTLLLALAVEVLGRENVLAAIGVSPSLPEAELQAARELSAQVGAELVEIATGELDNPNYASNPAERCYYCKADLFDRLAELARQRGFDAVASGANADDAGDFRPGLAAGRELGVRNPLMEAGLTKADVRELSRRMGLPTWDKPAMACLASRIPYGERITADRLRRVELAESQLQTLGFRACRVRDHNTLARIEVPVEDFDRLLAMRGELVGRLKSLGFTYVSMDLRGLRTGSMNEVLAL